ncbi:MAG: phage terminase large subunit [Alphaproteobacteria bacterium]
MTLSDMPETDGAGYEEVEALLRKDFYSFAIKAFETVNVGEQFESNWHLKLLCWRLGHTCTGCERRLLVALPPRNLKSFLVSVAFPAWCLGRDPTRRFICCSYTKDLAEKLHRDFVRIIKAPWYKKAFPKLKIGDKDSLDETTTTKGGFRYATSVGATLTGLGGHFIIIDDPINPKDATSEAERNRVNHWYSSTVLTRFDNPKTGVMIIISQRVHQNDLIGYVEELDDWTRIYVPAIATESETIRIGDDEFYERKKGEAMHEARMGLDNLNTFRKTLGPYNFQAQFQQNPMPPEGNLIKQRWFRSYDTQNPPKFDTVVQSWDTASSISETASYSVCTTWGICESRYYLMHVFRERIEYPDLIKMAQHLCIRRKPNLVLIENASTGRSLMQSLAQSNQVPFRAIKPEGDKAIRMEGVSAMIADGRVFLPAEAPWLDAFLSEILAFPNTRHDDQADSVSQFLRWAQTHYHRKLPEVRFRAIFPLDTVDHYRARTGVDVFDNLRGFRGY